MKNLKTAILLKKITAEPMIIVAVLLRLLLMPFFAHEDLLMTYRRALDIATGTHSLFSLTSPIPHAIEALTIKFYSLFTGIEYFAQINNYLTDIPSINALSFLFKTPYLVAELIFWWLFFCHFKPNGKLKFFILFNPIILYSVYLFGRYESFVLVLMTLVLIYLKKQRLLGALSSFALTLATRASLLLITPAFLLLKLSPKTKLLTTIGLAVFVLGSILLLPSATTQSFIKWLIFGQHTNFLLEATINLGWNFKLYLLPTFLIFAFFWLRRIFSLTKKLTNIDIFAISTTVFLFLYYALAIAHPQYFVWVLPTWFYLLWRFPKHPSLLTISWVISLFFLLILPGWEGKTTVGLLFPTADWLWFVSLRAESWLLLANISKSFLTGTLLYAVYELFQLSAGKNKS